MHRRTVLAGVAASSVALIAGCLANGRGGTDPGETPADGTATPTPDPCERDRIDRPDPGADVEPRRLPERPDEWTDATVETFVREYEAAYRQWLILTPDTTAYGHSEAVAATERTDRGYRVRLQTNFYYEEATHRGPVHADSPRYDVVYLVTGRRLLRAVAEEHAAEPTLDEAATMECW